jgi:hypothetical protein
MFAQWTTGTDIYNTNTGNVGIGNSLPQGKLHVEGKIYVKTDEDKVLTFENANGSWQYIQFKTGGTRKTWMGIDGASNFRIGKENGGAIILQGSNVGIGNATPGYQLDVSGVIASNSNTPLTFTNTGTGTYNRTVVYNDPSNGLYFDLARTTDLVSGTPIDFNVGARGGSGPLFTIKGVSGNVGIGTTNPAAKLSVVNSIVNNAVLTHGMFGYSGITNNRSITIQQIGNVSTANQYLFLNGGLGSSSVVGSPTLTSTYAPSFGFESNDNNLNILTSPSGTNATAIRAMSFSSGGNVGIGTTNINDASYKLFVETGIRTRKLKVDQTSWPDYVFHKYYNLPSLAEVEQFINKNKHLPDVPSAAEVEKNGLDLGENQALLLKKIEELTLYVIELKKENEKMNERIEKQQKEIQALKNNKKQNL